MAHRGICGRIPTAGARDVGPGSIDVEAAQGSEGIADLKYAIPAFLLAYLASPVDAIPDFLLGIGQTDDFGIAVLAFMLIIRLVPRLAPADVVNDHVREMGLVGRVEERAPANSDQTIEARFSVRR